MYVSLRILQKLIIHICRIKHIITNLRKIKNISVWTLPCCQNRHAFYVTSLVSSLLFIHKDQFWSQNIDPLCSFHRGIFRLLAEFQLDNKDNPSYTGKTVYFFVNFTQSSIFYYLLKLLFVGVSQMIFFPLCSANWTFLSCFHYDVCSGLSFQDFYQRCREAFLVNSDITLRTQLTEFRDHKLIRTKKVIQYTYMGFVLNLFTQSQEYVHWFLFAGSDTRGQCIFSSQCWNSRCYFSIIMNTRD